MHNSTFDSSSSHSGTHSHLSGVSWAAIIAGALAACVLSLLLFMLGIGLGLSSVSVWSGSGADGSTVGWGAVVWLVITQLISAAVGGYLAGRLRTKWQGVHTDEVYFRDTAHGFLAWALATLGMVILAGTVLTSAITGVGKAAGAVASGAATVVGGAASAVGSTVGAVGGVAGSAATAALSGAAGMAGSQMGGDNDWSYWISTMLRNGGPTEAQKDQAVDKVQEVAGNVADKAGEAAGNLSGTAKETAQAVQQKAESVKQNAPDLPRQAKAAAADARDAAADAKEVGMVFTQALRTGKLPESDAHYVAGIVAEHTDLTEAQAKDKVEQTFAQIQAQIESAKKTAEEAQQKALEAAEATRKAAAHSMLWMFVVLLIGAFVGSLSATYGGRMRNT